MLLQKTLSQLPSETNISNFMAENFGVNVRVEGGLYLFKYNQIHADWQRPETHECRGVILDSNGWKILSRPFDKFFNLDQGHCPIFEDKEFEERISDCILIEKADGSCIQMWHDGSFWRASTLGAISPFSIQGGSQTFDQLFWHLSGYTKNDLDTLFNPDCTYIFELCAVENQNVTTYNSDHIVLLGIRHRVSGEYISIFNHSEKLLRDKVRLPHFFNVSDIAIENKDQLWSWVEGQSFIHEKYGRNPEGFVIYSSDGKPLAKCKNKKYLSLHRFGGGDIHHAHNGIIECLMAETLDDIYHDLNPRMREFADKLQIHVADQMRTWTHELHSLAGNYESRKEYALAVQDRVKDSRVRPFAFMNIESIQNGKNIEDDFDTWLKDPKVYQKFESQWKESLS